VLDKLLKSNIAIVGGGNFCKKLLQLLFSEPFEDCHPTILGIADVDNQAEGRVLAKQMGIFTTADYRERPPM
jgi:acetaldehyde dehydrogenase (acetylating)